MLEGVDPASVYKVFGMASIILSVFVKGVERSNALLWAILLMGMSQI